MISAMSDALSLKVAGIVALSVSLVGGKERVERSKRARTPPDPGTCSVLQPAMVPFSSNWAPPPPNSDAISPLSVTPSAASLRSFPDHTSSARPLSLILTRARYGSPKEIPQVLVNRLVARRRGRDG